MTQHNLQVPEEWVDDFLRDCGLALTHPAQLRRLRRALQAILPKVRERLLSKESIDRAFAELKFQRMSKSSEDVRDAAKLAFDHAFPPESCSNHAQTTESRCKRAPWEQ